MNLQRSENIPPILQTSRLPVIAAPLFIISVPDLVIAQCKAGVIGSFPALNAREKEGDPIELEKWLKKITEELDRHNQKNPDDPAAPFAVNQIVHRSNSRLMRDIEICVKWKVPIWITSLGARPEVNEAAPRMKKSKEERDIEKSMMIVSGLKKGGAGNRYGKEFDRAKNKAVVALDNMISYAKIGI